MTDDYPSAREALFGNDHAANLYCACKWLAWHIFHMMFVVLASFVLAFFAISLLMYRGIRYIALRVDRWLMARAPSSAEVQPVSQRLSKAGETAKRRPVTRRLYGECPVDIKMDPRWFTRVKAVGETVLDAVEPPQPVYVCVRCERIYNSQTEPSRCLYCSSRRFEEVRESNAEERSREIIGGENT